jgi:hypothetical protein
MASSRWNIAGITVPNVCRDMGVEPTPELMWSVGLIVVNIYKKRYGALPPKDLRFKTYDDGVHCFAIYPETFRSTIEDTIRAQVHEKARQYEMFPVDRPVQGELFPPGGDCHV